MIKKLIKLILSFLVVILIIDPADKIFHLKSPLFLLIILLWLGLKFKVGIKYKIDSILMIKGLVSIAIFGIFTALLQNSDIDYSFSIGFLKSLSVLLLLIVIIDLDIEPDIILIRYAILIPVFTIFIYLILIKYPIFFGFIYDYLVVGKQAAMVARRSFYGYDLLSIYYKTSSTLVFPLSFFCSKFIYKKKDLFSFTMIFLFSFCLIISGTRANILGAVVILLYYIYRYLKLRRNVLLSLVGVCSVLLFSVLFFLSLSFNETNKSSEVKSGHLTSFVSNMSENPEYLIWGQGLGSKAYSIGTNTTQAQTELTYFDLIRFFGIPLACLFVLLIGYPMIYLYRNRMINDRNRYSFVAFVTYLLIAGTNPLLVSSTGMLIIIVMYSLMNRQIYNIKTDNYL